MTSDFRRTEIPELHDDKVLESRSVSDSPARGRLDLPLDDSLWDGADEIRAEIILPEGSEGTIGCDIVTDQRTEGFDTNDGYWFSALVSPRGGNIWKGPREFRFPAECFYTRGIPNGWKSLEAAAISVPDGAEIRNVRFVRRARRNGPRMTDKALFGALDPEIVGRPGISEPAEPAGPFSAEAGAAIASHFRAERRDRELTHVWDRGPRDRAAADAVVSGRIMDHHWPERIDWNANPIGYIEWSIRIHNLRYVKPLVAAWRETAEPVYAKAVERILTDWMANNPVPYGVRACGLAWGHSLVVAQRSYESMVEAFTCVCECDDTADRSIIDMLKSLWEHAGYLLAYESFPPSNKTIAEARAVAGLSCAFPEFVGSQAWKDEAFRRLNNDMRIQVFPDGASYELSPGYQLAIAAWFLEALETGRRYGAAVPEELETGVRAMYAWSTSIARPDFTRPSVSDAGSLDTAYGELLERPAEILEDHNALWVAGRGEKGRRPEYGSIARRDSGYFVMRSGWDLDDRYLLFEGGPFGRFHQHEDALSIDVYAYGTPFIVDPGITSYFPNDWTTFYRSTRAHNTVLVDGGEQMRRVAQTQNEWTAGVRDATVWLTSESCDVAAAEYAVGYQGVTAAVIHRRWVMFVKPDYFLVFDELRNGVQDGLQHGLQHGEAPTDGPHESAGSGADSGTEHSSGVHTYEALFHFMPFRVLVDPVKPAVRTGRMSEPNIEVVALTDLTPALICGRNEPVQGWVSIGRQDVPAPVAAFQGCGELPFRTGYVIIPFGAERTTAGAQVQVANHADSWDVSIRLPNRSETVRMTWGHQGVPVLS